VSKNDSSGKSVIRGYTFESGFLKIDGVPDIYQLVFNSNGDVASQDGFTIYQSSIADASEDDKMRRVKEIFKGNEAVAKVFLRILKNKQSKPAIEIRNNKIFDIDNEEKATSSYNNGVINKTARAFFSMNTSAELIDYFGKENVKKRKAYGFENQDYGYEYAVFPGTDKEAAFYFSGERMHSITFKRKTSYWVLPLGVQIGMSVSDIQKKNGATFTINQIETDASGLVLNWNGGKFENLNVSMQFESTKNELTNEEYYSMETMNSGDKKLQKLGLIVKDITLINPEVK
jgi:hypothetical protein